MPANAAAFLPRSRSLQRRRGLTAWWIAIGAATIANLAIVLLLSQASRMHGPVPPPPIATIRLHQVRPPPPQATTVVAEPAIAAAVITPAPVALPSLDLPAASNPDTWTLPTLPGLDRLASLPLSVPAFATLAPSDLEPPTIAAPTIDTPAQRLGAFDLDRYYPRSARARGLSGRTRLQISLDAHGEITAVEISESTPPGTFEQAATRLAHSLRYRPAQAAGQDVPSVVVEVIEWSTR